MAILRPLRLNAAWVLGFQLAYLTSWAIASDFEMSLQVKSATRRVSVTSTQELPSPEKPQPRPVFKIGSQETLLISWTATNHAKQSTFPDVLIRCLVAAENEPGQADAPDPQEAVQESALTMDFKPGDSAEGEFSLAIEEPGTYLVRVETLNMLEQHHHEHYVALDLVRK